MSNTEAAAKLHEINRQQYYIIKALKAHQEPAPKKRIRKLNIPMCLFWLNALAAVSFVATNAIVKVMSLTH